VVAGRRHRADRERARDVALPAGAPPFDLGQVARHEFALPRRAFFRLDGPLQRLGFLRGGKLHAHRESAFVLADHAHRRQQALPALRVVRRERRVDLRLVGGGHAHRAEQRDQRRRRDLVQIAPGVGMKRRDAVAPRQLREALSHRRARG
jgi:hypothetical protein